MKFSNFGIKTPINSSIIDHKKISLAKAYKEAKPKFNESVTQSDQISLDWTEKSTISEFGLDITGYEIVVKSPDGTIIRQEQKTVSELNDVISGLNAETRYDIEIYSLSFLGRSEPQTVSIYTDAVILDDPPQITAVSHSPSAPIVGVASTFSVTVTDDNGVAGVVIYYTEQGQIEKSATMIYSGKNNIWNATINNRYSGTTTYYAVATDTIGQETTSSTYSYISANSK